jgi:Phosphorylase superfamily
MSQSSFIDMIFVPQGPELNAVRRGISRSGTKVRLVAVPIGPSALRYRLEQWLQAEFKAFNSPPTVLLMGLCGSLSPNLEIGDWVLYRSCRDVRTLASVPSLDCDTVTLTALKDRLGDQATIVTAAMCDRLIHRGAEKQALAHRYGLQAVDMEGYTFLATLAAEKIPVGMLRVVSDDAVHDLPDLSTAITAVGTLNPVKLGLIMAAHPRSALRLIQGSLKSLKQLENAVARLFGD